MNQEYKQNDSVSAVYDDEAEAAGWYGPEVAFGLMYPFVQPGDSILDIGIGTGLASALFRKAGLKVHGMDVSPKMLDTCRAKGFEDLKLHDLRHTPYPYDSESMDHVVCVGVFHFFHDLSPVFEETARILRQRGLFAFVVGDRKEDESHSIAVEAEHTNSEKMVEMYSHSPEQIGRWTEDFGFRLARTFTFTMYMDRERMKSRQATMYLARKTEKKRALLPFGHREVLL